MAGINRSFDRAVIDIIESAAKTVKALPVNLGGVSGTFGGSGGPPGGFIGQLPQTRVSYDSSELGTLFTPASGMSLYDNLNHIRYRLDVIESGGSGSGVLTVEQWGGTPSISPVTTIVFSGATVVDNGGGEVEVQITASGGSGATTFLELTDTPSNYATFSGYAVVVKGDETGLEFVPVASGGSFSLTLEEYDGSPVINNVDRIIFSGAALTDLGGGDVLVQVSASGGGTVFWGDIEGTVSNQSDLLHSTTGVVPLSIADAELLTSIGNTERIPFLNNSLVLKKISFQDIQTQISEATTFLDLADTPSIYTGYSGYHVSVKGDETGLEFIPLPSGGSSALVVEQSGGSPTISNVDRIIFSGAVVTDLGGGDVLVTISGVVASGLDLMRIDQSGGSSDTYGVLSGLINGSNVLFTVSEGSYVSGSLLVYLNGQLQTQGSSEDWVETNPESGTFSFNTAPVSGDQITAVYVLNSPEGNADTLDGYHASAFAKKLGWEPYSEVIPTRQWASDPNYELKFTGADLTGLFEEGQPVKWTQNSIVRYGWIAKEPTLLSGNTHIVLLTRTDDASANHDVLDTATFPITNFNYGLKGTIPMGMPDKSDGAWDIVVTDTNTRTKTTPTINTWYGATNTFDGATTLPSVVLPIGAWKDVIGEGIVRGQVPAASSNFNRVELTLSTSPTGTSGSEANFIAASSINAGGDGSGLLVNLTTMRTIPNNIHLTIQTQYYILARIDVSSSPTSIQVQGGISTTRIRASCAYL